MTRQPGQPAGARGPGALTRGEDDGRELAPSAADCAAGTLPLLIRDPHAKVTGDTWRTARPQPLSTPRPQAAEPVDARPAGPAIR